VSVINASNNNSASNASTNDSASNASTNNSASNASTNDSASNACTNDSVTNVSADDSVTNDSVTNANGRHCGYNVGADVFRAGRLRGYNFSANDSVNGDNRLRRGGVAR